MRAPDGENIAPLESSIQLLREHQAAVDQHEQLMTSLASGAPHTCQPRPL
jgi:hypothetical protein